MNKALVQISKLSIGFNRKNLFNNVNLSLNEGELVVLLGENGAGKSSLMKVLTGNLLPNQGRVFIKGKDIRSLSIEELAYHFSVVFNVQLSFMKMSVRDVVAIGRTPHLGWFGHLSKNDERMIRKSLEMVDVLHLINESLETLSDGERQRVMIAKALAQDTSVVVLDEPTAHLDVKNRVLLLKLLRDVAKHTSKTILLSTHELELALKLADKAWLISDEKIIEGLPEDLVLKGLIQKEFNSKNVLFNTAVGAFDVSFEERSTVRIIGGTSEIQYWYQNALKKVGVVGDEESQNILCLTNRGGWSFKNNTGDTITELIVCLRECGTNFD